MIDLRSLRGILSALIIVAIWLGIIELALGATRPWWPDWMHTDTGIGPLGWYKQAGEQISGIRNEKLPAEEPVGLILGASTMHLGIDPALLESAFLPPMHWRRMTVVGGATPELEAILQLALEYRIKPAIVVIALEIRMLARNPLYRNPRFDDRVDVSPGRWLDDLKSLKTQAIEGLLSNTFNDCFPDRSRIFMHLNVPLERLRIAALRFLGQDIQAMFLPQVDAGAVVPIYPVKKVPPSGLKLSWEDISSKGGFDPTAYSTRGERSRSLVNMIRLAESAGAQVVILVLPEESRLRAGIPEIAMKSLATLLREDFGKDSPPVIDLRDAIPDDLFFDYIHLDPSGRQVLTKRFIEELNKLKIRTRGPNIERRPPAY
ncbi:MAG: hypothetical protein ACLQGP_31220 [Isosphaeraceae bacterium]